MNQVQELISLLNQKAKLAALLAPSFPIVFQYPQIIGKLKRLGFSNVLEVSAGAKNTNSQVLDALKKDEKARFITSPCASFVRMVRGKYPNLIKYLALSVDSPMAATAKIAKEKFPECKPVFIGPCLAKKLESSEDHPELNILVLTYKELEEVFASLQIQDDPNDSLAKFNIEFKDTRLYPISGGLAKTSKVSEILAEDQLQVVSGWNNCIEALEDFEKNPNIRLLDILFCDGGCINGPGIKSELSIEERRNKIIEYSNL